MPWRAVKLYSVSGSGAEALPSKPSGADLVVHILWKYVIAVDLSCASVHSALFLILPSPTVYIALTIIFVHGAKNKHHTTFTGRYTVSLG